MVSYMTNEAYLLNMLRTVLSSNKTKSEYENGFLYRHYGVQSQNLYVKE